MCVQIKQNLNKKTDEIRSIANSTFTGRDKDVHIIDSGEASCLALSKLLDEKKEGKIEDILDNAELLTTNLLLLSQALMKTQDKADVLLTETSGTIRENREEISIAVNALRESLELVSVHTESIIQGVEGTTHNLNEFSRKIRQNPGLLLSSEPPAEVGVFNE